MKTRTSHGSGRVAPGELGALGEGSVIEETALVFHPARVFLGAGVYVAHYAVLQGYHSGELRIGDGSWVGPHCLLHGAGGLFVGRDVGIGPGVRILTSVHQDPGGIQPVMEGALAFAPVVIGDGCDLGCNAVVLPGVTLGRGVQVGAGAVVTRDLPDGAVAIGAPARVTRQR
ncbi:MAG: DapH/DapD/GlmU-related protein [Polyangia bacterium]|jgi:acetyltransferase-like isoleucine patch superfamily enzyme|nr:DapH/DapD/GlmU-related protein [Polyangia bacterium]